nr:uncharacterized protein LOC111505102 [Leptinotarsa decemlineata]
MDLSKELNQIAINGREAEIRAKKMYEMTERKYDLQRKIKDANTMLQVKKENLTDIRKETVSLSCKLSVVTAKEQIAKETVHELVHQVVAAEKETEDAQKSYWQQINDFILSSTQYLKKHSRPMKKKESNLEMTKDARELKLRYLKLEGELEACRSFEKYQIRKIKELKLLKEMMEI